jgi:hypothetical protein
LAGQFDAIDSNKDGYLTPGEMQAHATANRRAKP